MDIIQRRYDFESSLKSWDTEEFIDIHFYRPLGYCWALLFRKLGVTPNTVSILSIFIGIASGLCFYYTDLKINIIGMLLLMWANSYDSADGQLARMTDTKTRLGRILDGLSSQMWFIVIYMMLCFRMMPEWGWWIWLLAAAAGYSHSRQAAIADYYRTIHLHFLKGRSGSELAYSKTLREDYKRLSWKQDGFVKAFEYMYLGYTKAQEAWTPRFQKLINFLRDKYGKRAPIEFRMDFRMKSLPLMKYANMLSFNTRVIVLFISLIINKPWIYFVFELTVLNLMLAYMMITHEHFCGVFYKQIKLEDE
ncbi:MAG: CDP-alcohol phosphatidyltransferase family protein [Tannerella sp.]|nr:CDP-alcohol phosphatidyltransferase family protein [Tannerella sp.]